MKEIHDCCGTVEQEWSCVSHHVTHSVHAKTNFMFFNCRRKLMNLKACRLLYVCDVALCLVFPLTTSSMILVRTPDNSEADKIAVARKIGNGDPERPGSVRHLNPPSIVMDKYTATLCAIEQSRIQPPGSITQTSLLGWQHPAQPSVLLNRIIKVKVT